jgi:hypothetical protein
VSTGGVSPCAKVASSTLFHVAPAHDSIWLDLAERIDRTHINHDAATCERAPIGRMALAARRNVKSLFAGPVHHVADVSARGGLQNNPRLPVNDVPKISGSQPSAPCVDGQSRGSARACVITLFVWEAYAPTRPAFIVHFTECVLSLIHSRKGRGPLQARVQRGDSAWRPAAAIPP